MALIAGLLCGCTAPATFDQQPATYQPTNGYYQQTLQLRLPYVTYETNR